MLTASGSRELRAVAYAMKLVDRNARSAINKGTRATMNPVWRGAVDAQARTAQDRAVLNKGVRIAAGNPPQALAAGSTRKLSGGLVPAQQWAGVEFGADQSKRSTYTTRSPRGKAYRVTRHTARGLPAKAPKGRVVYKAFAQFAPRLVDLWVQTAVRVLAEASEAGGKR